MRNIQTVFEWYSKQIYYFSFVNNILALSNDPKAGFYFRLPFSDLYNSIRDLYHEQNNAYKNMTVYRRYQLNNNEFNFYFTNEGGYIEN